MIQTVPLNDIRPSPLNPRKVVEGDALTELAESIRTEGLLQNLVVRDRWEFDDDHAGPRYELAAGERRWRAMQQLVTTGDLPAGYPVPVVVRDLTDLQLLQLATTENLARADMTPMEEARAFQRMLELGSDVDTIAAETGFSLATIRKRVALTQRLAPSVITALEDGAITLGQAQAFTIGHPDTQALMLETRQYNDGAFYQTPASIRSWLSHQAIPVSRAAFPIEQYQGSFTESSIFDEDGEPTFDDVDQFRRLQAAWVEHLREEYAKRWGWVEVQDDYFSPYRYDAADDGEDPAKLGVIIEHREDGTVTVHERLKKREAQRYGSSGQAEKDPLALTQRHHAVINEIRTRTLQTALLEDPTERLVTVTGIMGLLHLYWSGSLVRTDVVNLEAATPTLQNAIDEARAELGVEHLFGEVYEYQGRDDRSLTTMHALLNQPIHALRALHAALITLHVQAGGQYENSRRVDPTTSALWTAALPGDYLPTWSELGADWLQLYPKARLEQLHQEATGLSSDGKTRKAMIAGILDHSKPGWLEQVPDELYIRDLNLDADEADDLEAVAS